ncbi:MAG TPA: hypothetical protein VK671_14885 [Mucilaginibacter sp.]|jgi:hypothetical protein|nr:hypothetical protein [Mucilaginibacter sp.]
MDELENYLIRNNWLRNQGNSYWLTLGNYYFIEVVLYKDKFTAVRNIYDPHYTRISNSEEWQPSMMHKALVRFIENYNKLYAEGTQRKKLA